MDDPVALTDRTWLDQSATRNLSAALDRAGIDFRFVGGAVRDTLLGRRVADIDIATPALPDAVVRAVEAARLKAIPTGLSHGTVTAVSDGRHFEITTLRRDLETDGRHATVAFTRDWREDAARRDFTMNALYADRDGRIMDFFEGIDDARAGRVRFIGDPALRITEDALRILRFFRFHAHYGRGALNADGLAACTRLAPMIDRLSGERVRDELFKLLAAPDPAAVWRAMDQAEVAAHVLPQASGAEDLGRLVAIEAALALPPGPLRRLAVLAGPLDADRVAWLKDRLKLSNRDTAHLGTIAKSGARVASAERHAFGRALYGADPGAVRDAALAAHARSGRPDAAALADLLRFLESWREPRFPLTGADLEARGVTPGPELGRLLAKIEDWWVEAGFQPGRAACLAELDRRIAVKAKSPRAGGT